MLFSCGVPMAGVSLRVVDPSTMASCEDGCVGEIWLSSACVTAGYYNKPELTAQVFQVRSPSSTQDLGMQAIFTCTLPLPGPRMPSGDAVHAFFPCFLNPKMGRQQIDINLMCATGIILVKKCPLGICRHAWLERRAAGRHT